MVEPIPDSPNPNQNLQEEIPELPVKDTQAPQEQAEIVKKEMERLVSCSFCNRSFYESRLEGHRKICTKDKPFKPLSRKNNKNNSCYFDKDADGNAQHFPEGHEKKEENEQKSPIFDEKEAFKEQILLKCEKCERKFDRERIEKHMGVCKGKVETKIEKKSELKPRKSMNIGKILENHDEHTDKTTENNEKTTEYNEKTIENNEKRIEVVEKTTETPIKEEKPDPKNPLLVMKNYTKQLEEKRKTAHKQRMSTPQKKATSKKSSESPSKRKEKQWGMTESTVIIKNLEESIEKTLEKALVNTNASGLETPISQNMKNCEFCGKMFPEKTVRNHAKICKNLNTKAVKTPRENKILQKPPTVEENKKVLLKRPSVIMLREETSTPRNQRNYRVYRSFQPSKLYDFKY